MLPNSFVCGLVYSSKRLAGDLGWGMNSIRKCIDEVVVLVSIIKSYEAQSVFRGNPVMMTGHVIN